MSVKLWACSSLCLGDGLLLHTGLIDAGLQNRTDVVVVGSGIGGLVCAGLLARYGHRVTVCATGLRCGQQLVAPHACGLVAPLPATVGACGALVAPRACGLVAWWLFGGILTPQRTTQVCESHAIAGGAAHSFRSGGFEFDSGPKAPPTKLVLPIKILFVTSILDRRAFHSILPLEPAPAGPSLFSGMSARETTNPLAMALRAVVRTASGSGRDASNIFPASGGLPILLMRLLRPTFHPLPSPFPGRAPPAKSSGRSTTRGMYCCQRAASACALAHSRSRRRAVAEILAWE